MRRRWEVEEGGVVSVDSGSEGRAFGRKASSRIRSMTSRGREGGRGAMVEREEEREREEGEKEKEEGDEGEGLCWRSGCR